MWGLGTMGHLRVCDRTVLFILVGGLTSLSFPRQETEAAMEE